jgi:hypothetical protein
MDPNNPSSQHGQHGQHSQSARPMPAYDLSLGGHYGASAAVRFAIMLLPIDEHRH